LFFTLLGFLAIGNPSEFRFQQRLVDDYGSIHQGMTLNFDQLKAMGSSQYQSYVFFSKYHYTFGSIGVRYFGIGFFTFHTGSHHTKKINSQDKRIIS